MVQPAVANGVLITLTNGSNVKQSAFSVPGATVFAGGFPVVHETALLGGLPFTATLKTVITRVMGGQLVVLVGSTVTDSAGYTGVVPPTSGPGPKFSFG